MVWESFNWHIIFQSDFVCHLMLKQTDFQCLPCSWRIMQWFNLFLRLNSCSKIPVLSLLKAEAERSLTAFVSGTTESIKLHKVKNVWEIINSWTGGVCHQRIVQSKVCLSTKLPSERFLLWQQWIALQVVSIRITDRIKILMAYDPRQNSLFEF